MITRAGDTSTAAQVHFHTESGTSSPSATKDVDFKSVDTIVQFAPGQTTATVEVKINGDTIKEANERFRGVLDMSSGPSITRSVALATIIDDD